LEELWANAQAMVTIFGIKIVTAIVIYVLGRLVAKSLRKFTQKVMTKRGVDDTLVIFVGSLVYTALLIFVILAALAQLGIQTTSFIAVVGAAGLAIGLALQGSLANFASGVLLIIFRPFKAGDYIEGAGVAGVVEQISIFTTQLRTPDNKTIIIPNSGITAGNITNYSTKEERRVDMVFGVGYSDDIDKVKSVIAEVLSHDDRILDDPAATIAVVELADSSVNFVVRPWVKSADYWNVYFDTMESIKKRFDADGISIPFPQRDVHLFNVKE
jgi:small conductance mechanosensitive channel